MNPFTAANNVYSIQVKSGCIYFSSKKKDPDQKNLAYHTLTTIRSNLDRNPRFISLRKEDRDVKKIVNDIFNRYENSYNASFWQKVEDFFTCCWTGQTKLEEIRDIRDEILLKLQKAPKSKEKTIDVNDENLTLSGNEIENAGGDEVSDSKESTIEVEDSQELQNIQKPKEKTTLLYDASWVPSELSFVPSWVKSLIKIPDITVNLYSNDYSFSSIRKNHHIFESLYLINAYDSRYGPIRALILKLKIEHVSIDPARNDELIEDDRQKEMLGLAFANSNKPFSLLASVNFMTEDIIMEDQLIAHENKVLSGNMILEGGSFRGIQNEPLSEEQIEAFSVENQDQLPIDQRRNLNWMLYRLLSNQSVEVRDWKLSLLHSFDMPTKGYWKISLDQ
ncbi:MAG: hypothetical protein H0T62_06515 [Parachlamydiaceae bacterium]|nr:hypothetical protein [Parachlamydiaceae bacterium]